MANQKKPFHEVLSKKPLIATLVGAGVNFTSAKAAEVRTILDVLLASKMPAAAAHQIASDHLGLPSFLTEVGEGYLSRFAEEVLANLKGCEDD